MRTVLISFAACGHEREIEWDSVALAKMIGGDLWCLTCDDVGGFVVLRELPADTRPFQPDGVHRSGDGVLS